MKARKKTKRRVPIDPRDQKIDQLKQKVARLRGALEATREECVRLHRREGSLAIGSQTLRDALVSTERENGRLVDSHERMLKYARLLERCRNVMEANDPVNARDIFGPLPAESQAMAS